MEVTGDTSGGEREVIWEGEIEWIQLVDRARGQRVTANDPCTMSSVKVNGLPEVMPNNWPSKLIMQLIPKQLVQTLGVHYFSNSKSVLLHPANSDSMKSMGRMLSTGFAGCVHFPGAVGVKVLILLYSANKDTFLGFIPNDQISFVERIRSAVQEQKNIQGGGGRQRQQEHTREQEESKLLFYSNLVLNDHQRESGQEENTEANTAQAGENKEKIFVENGREVRRMPVKLTSGEICWMECV